MDSNDASSSPNAVKEKLSLRKRLLIKKSTKVGCSPESNGDSLDKSNNDLYKSSGDIFLSKRLHENEDRTYCSDSEANTSETKGRLSNSNSSFLTCSHTSIRTCTRPRSMIEETSLNKPADLKHSIVVNKSIEILKQPPVHRAKSDPNCDTKSNIIYNGVKGINYSNESINNVNNRISSSLSDVQQTLEKNDTYLNDDKSSLAVSSESSKYKDENSSCTPRSGSADSLARNSLLAAKVLRLIPAQKARERNFLLGRLASNSLLGAAELDRVFPNREVEIFVGTWNMNGQSPPSELNDFLFPNAMKNVPDILVIGSQESTSERSEWEVTIQESLGPSHLLLHSAALGTLLLCIFIRRDLIWFCSMPEDSSISVRPGTAFRTKGAVAISFALFGTSFLFITSHLTAHQGKVKERVHDIKRITRSLELPKNLPIKHKSKDVTANFDVAMWCGDLNFRLSEDRESVMRGLRTTEECNTSNIQKAMSTSSSIPTAFPSLLQADQLSEVLSSGTVLKGFKEATIHFPPTYKYDPGTQRFDTSSKQRTPAYTDRILYKTKTQSHLSITNFRKSSMSSNSEHTSHVKCLAYDSVPNICTSDHKPVWALFTASLRPGVDIVPLAAGLFNREVYLEGIKRRAAVLDHPPGTSAICSLQ